MLTQIDNPTVMYYYLDNFHGQKFSKSDFLYDIFLYSASMYEIFNTPSIY